MPKANDKSTKQTVWYKKTWVVILFLIFLFPVGLLLMWKYMEWKTVTKVAVSGALALVLVLAAVFSPPSITVASSLEPVEEGTYTLRGEVSPHNALITVNGRPAIKDGAAFSVGIKLAEGDNTLTIVAIDGKKRTEKKLTIHRFTKEEIAKRKAAEQAKHEAQKKAKEAQIAKAQAERKKAEEKKQRAEAAKVAELARQQQAKSDAKAMADKISVSSTIIKKPTDGDNNEHYFYWFDVSNTSGKKFDGYIEITLIGSLDNSRGTTKSEKLSINSASALYTGIQAMKIDSKSRPLAFGGDTQAFRYKILINNYSFDYPSIQPLSDKSEDLSGFN